jgi:hypothetical protein
LALSTAKRAILYRWDRQPAEGVVQFDPIHPASFLRDDRLEWMTREGHLEICSLESCKALCFVSESGKSDLFSEHNLFERRPRVPGLWTRFKFRDGTLLDGILSHNLLEWPASGYFVVPPQARASRQRVFIPRSALAGTELRGVVGGPGYPLKGREPARKEERQLSIFDL